GPWMQNSRASRRGKSRQPSRLRYVPRLDILEERLAPATLVVNSHKDNTNSGDGYLTLREAILSVNQGSLRDLSASGQVTGTLGTNDTIQFDPIFDGQSLSLNAAPASTNAGPSAFAISNGTKLVIDGETGLTHGITIGRGSATPFRAFFVDSTADLTLKGLTL